MHRSDQHERYGGEVLRGKAGLVADHPTRRNLHVLGIAAPPVRPGWEVARRLVLRRDVPLRRIGRKARSYDDPVSNGQSVDLGAKLLDVADNVQPTRGSGIDLLTAPERTSVS